MKSKREVLAVVVGRNRRVYSRVYKMVNRIEAFSKHYYEMEKEKSRDEGFRPVNMKVKEYKDTVVFRIQYEPITC